MKRILALILAIGLCFSAVSVTADTSVELPQDYVSMSKALSALSIMDAAISADAYNGSITRGEFAGYLLNLIKMKGTETTVSFPDLPKSHAYYAQVSTAAELGLYTADAKGNIRPDALVTVGEASRAVVTLLGFSVRAENKGGTGTAYIAQANRLKLLNSGFAANDKLTRATAVQLLYNALLADTAYTLPPKYSLTKGDTLLESCHGLKLGSGLVTANRYYGISEDKTDGNGLVINGIYYKAAENADTDCVGLYVDFFYDSANTVYAVSPSDYDKLTVEYDDIKGFANNKYTYYKAKGKKTTASISKDAYVLKNYKPVLSTSAMLPGVNGEVTLIDYNDDGMYEIVFVNTYTEMIVTGINDDDKSITGKNGKTVKYTDADSVLVFKNGEIASFGDIAVGNTLSVCTAGEGFPVVVYVSDSTVEGSVTSLGKDDVYVRGHAYPLSNGFDTSVALKLGSSGVFYLNAKGEIVYFDSQSSTYKFGYLMGVDVSKGISSDVLFKVLTADNEIKIFTGKDKIEYNGAYTAASAVASDLSTSGNQGTAEQLIRYALNSKNEIYYLESALSNGGTLSLNEERLHLSASMTNGNRGFEAKTAAGDKTVQFSVPVNPNSDDMFYKVVSSVKKETTNFKAYNVKRYSVIADAIVGYTPGGGKTSGSGGGPAGDIDYEGHTAIITDISTTLNINELPAKKVTLLQNTGWPLKVTELSYIVADNSAWETQKGNEADTVQNGDNLNVGDVILYSLNSSGEIGRINRIYNAAEKSIDSAHGGTNPVTNNNGSFVSPLRLLESYAYKTEDTFIMVSTVPITSLEPDRSYLEVHDYQYENVIIVERVRDDVNIRVGKISDIKTYENYGTDCDKVLINTNWGTVRTVVAIRSDV